MICDHQLDSTQWTPVTGLSFKSAGTRCHWDHRSESDATNKARGVKILGHFVIVDALRNPNQCYFEVTCCSGRCVENKIAAGVICLCIHELRVNDVRNEMMDDDSSFLAADFGWWWVGLILDQEAGSRVDWADQWGDLMRKHCLTYI